MYWINVTFLCRKWSGLDSCWLWALLYVRHTGDFGSVKCACAWLSPRTASFFMDAEQILREVKITMYAADTLASQALCRTFARRSYTKNKPGGVFSSPKLKKFWLRVNSFRKLKTKILLAPKISPRFETNLARNFSPTKHEYEYI